VLRQWLERGTSEVVDPALVASVLGDISNAMGMTQMATIHDRDAKASTKQFLPRVRRITDSKLR
jgi:DNA-binding phage protein